MARIQIVCAKCKRALEINLNSKQDSIEVELCEDCVADQINEAIADMEVKWKLNN